ncbi:hypothetical protein HORIV_35130 [Vreelandella olivaria]|uniref:Uncharacterized protein n=1 Tax=Vreelandella olivaria TaxID=390919 RepID=A0ABM7GKE0_9GAMM|nr:hypothetical protein HORIV_35130 [Halomonas olivaria]
MDNELLKRIEEITRATRKLQQQFDIVEPKLNERMSAVRESMQPYETMIARVTKFIHQIQSAYDPLLHRLSELAPAVPQGLETLKEGQVEKIRLLAENGWFPDFTGLSLGGVFELISEYSETYHTAGREKPMRCLLIILKAS